MTIKVNYNQIAPWALFAVMIEKMITNFLKLRDPLDWIFMLLFILFVIIFIKKLFNKNDFDKIGLFLVIILLFWFIIGFFRAISDVNEYFVWKTMFKQLFIALFLMIIIISSNFEVIKKYLGLYWKFFIPLIVFSYTIDGTSGQLDYSPFTALMLFFVLLPANKKWILLTIIIFYFLTSIQRNDLIKILFCSVTGLSISYFYRIIPQWSIKLAHLLFLIAPFILLGLAVTERFNIFDMHEYIKGDYTQKVETTEGLVDDDLQADTRTSIFKNVFYTMNKYDAWVLGRNTAFGDDGVDESWGLDESTGLFGRYGNEVGILDILLWYGLIGVVIYFMIYVRATYLAVYKSRNRFAKSVGIYVAFLWMWSFVWEKPSFDTYFMMGLILLGLCFSKSFRQFTDQEMSIWVKGIFFPNSKKTNFNNANSLDFKRSIS